MSEKKKKGIRKHLKTVLERLHGGLEAGALRGGNEEVPHSTLDEILKLLEKAEVIFKAKDGKWYYFWEKQRGEYQDFKTVEEYKTKLRHSESLVRPTIKNKLTGEDLDIKALIHSKNLYYFLQHLESEYSDIHDLWKEWEGYDSEEKKVKTAFDKEVEKIVSEKGFDIKEDFRDVKEEGRQISSGIFDSVKKYSFLATKEDFEVKVELIEKYDGIKDPIIRMYLTRNKSVKEELEELIENCIRSEHIKALYSELSDIEDKTRKVYSKLIIEIELIITKIIEDGEPLRGTCKRCPKVTIGRVA